MRNIGTEGEHSYVVSMTDTRPVSIVVPVNVLGTDTHAIIDTGAEVTVIGEHFFHELPADSKPHIEKAARCLVVADKEREMKCEGIARVTISIGKTRCEWPVYVAPIADSMLLGCDIFDYMNMTLNSTQGLYLNGEWITCDTLRKCGMETPVQLLVTVPVHSKCEIILPGFINNDDWTETTENALFEPVEEGLTDVMIARALVDPKTDIYLRLLNLSDRAIKLEKGTLIGHLYSVSDLVEFKGNDGLNVTGAGMVPGPHVGTIHVRHQNRLPDCMPTGGIDGPGGNLDGGLVVATPTNHTVGRNGSGSNKLEYVADPDVIEENPSRSHVVDSGPACECIDLPSVKQIKEMNDEVIPDYLRDLFQRSCKNLSDNYHKEQLAKLLNEHSGAFAQDKMDLGTCSLIKHQINTGSAAPIRQPLRRTPKGFEGEEEKYLKQQLQAGVIVPSTSPWASPVVLVRKKSDGSVRWCIDYRKLNNVTVMDAYPLPCIDTCLDYLSTARFFSTADLQSGYWQLKLDEKDRAKTAFITRYGLYEYTKLPMGLSSAPSTFQRCMELIFRGLQWKKLLIYLDDIIIYSPDIESHLSDLSEVLDLLQKAGLKLKPAKCHLLQSEVLFLGHIVSVNGLLPNPALLENVKNWNPPKDVKQIQQFIGLCNYYRRFIYGFSDLASPITELTKKDVPFRWSEECQNAFDLLKQALCSAPILAYPKNEGTYILHTDASDSGVSGVLSQVQEGCERVICYGSKKLSKTQRNYCVTRRELLAAITFITEYQHYLLGHSFILITDHGSLRWLFGFKGHRANYQFKIEHRAGRLHTNADALSRKWCGIKECDCYERDIKPEMLPCGGCKKCLRMHEEWQRFQEEVDDIIPLASTHASPGKNIQGATPGFNLQPCYNPEFNPSPT